MNISRIKQKLKDKVILITGGTGFIGSSLCKRLLEYDAKIICFDNLCANNIENIKEISDNENFSFVKGDVNNLEQIRRIFKNNKIDYVFHYAAIVGVKKTLSDPLGVLKDLDGIKNILELCRIHRIKKIVFSSSSEVYGDPIEFPQHEDFTPLNARLPYAIVKAAGEAYFKSYWEKFKLPTVNLRFFNVYGPCQNCSLYGFVTAIFIKQALNNEKLTVFGDGLQTRDFVFIEDNLNASILALLSSQCNGQSINIGTGKETSVIELAKKVIKLSEKDIKIHFCQSRKVGDMQRRLPSIEKMKNILKYEPMYKLEDGLTSTFNWYRKKIYESI